MKRQIKEFRGYKVMVSQQSVFGEMQPLEQIRVIKLSVRVGRVVYRDQVEWDINNDQNSPEFFAECVCADKGLGPEFLLPITHQIREKVLDLQKVAHNERRLKTGNLQSEMEFVGKSDGSYAQTRTGQTTVGLTLDQFHTEHNLPIIAPNGLVNNSDVVMQEMSLAEDTGMGKEFRTMIRSLETVDNKAGAKRQANYFKTSV